MTTAKREKRAVPTKRQVRELRDEAAQAGDAEMVKACTIVLEDRRGKRAAMAAIVAAMDRARAMAVAEQRDGSLHGVDDPDTWGRYDNPARAPGGWRVVNEPWGASHYHDGLSIELEVIQAVGESPSRVRCRQRTLSGFIEGIDAEKTFDEVAARVRWLMRQPRRHSMPPGA